MNHSVELPCPPPRVAAVWGAVLHQGLMIPERNESRAGQILDLWGCGCIELMQATTCHFPRLWQQLDEPWRKAIIANPGDDEFMVIFSLGKFLGDFLVKNDGLLPNPSVIQTVGIELMSQHLSTAPRS